MNDPTYIKAEIEANLLWHLAWVMSELRNDSAPIGWSRYLPDAEELCHVFKIAARNHEASPEV